MCTTVPLPHILFSLWFQLKKHQTNHFESQNLDNMNQSLLNKNIFTQCIFKTKMLLNTKMYHHNFRNWADGKYIHGDANHDRFPWNKEKISWKFVFWFVLFWGTLETVNLRREHGVSFLADHRSGLMQSKQNSVSVTSLSLYHTRSGQARPVKHSVPKTCDL